MNTNKISFKILIIVSMFTALLTATFLSSYMVIRGQKDDGLIVNLAGRQRMLSQRLTKEVLTYSATTDERARLKLRDQILETTQVIDVTQVALMNGGPAPLQAKMGGAMQTCPPASSASKDILNQVQSQWDAFKENVTAFVTSGDAEGLAFVQEHNVSLLESMDKAVSQMQSEVEQRVSNLFIYLGTALTLGFVLSVASVLIVRRSITQPLQDLSRAADDISHGKIDGNVPSQGADEIVKLSASLDRMRTSIAVMLSQKQPAPHADSLEGL